MRRGGEKREEPILFTIGSLGIGGSESQLALLVEGLSRRGWRCDVAVLDPRGPLRARLEATGAAVYDLGYDPAAFSVVKVALLVRALCRLWWRAVRSRPRVLHAYLPLTNCLGAVAGRLAGVPIVVTARRALGTHQDRHPLWRPFDRLAGRLSHVVTVNSQAVARDSIARDGIAPDRLMLIANGLDFSRFDAARGDRARLRAGFGVDEATPVIAVVGNLIPYKGHRDLIEAVARLAPRPHPARFLLVGEDRGIQQDLRALAHAHGMADRIVFLGRREDVPAVLNAADGFVMPSHEEGSSNALLEAMAVGLPIVATEVGGNREALEDGRLGALVPPHAPVELARAIDALLDEIGAHSRTDRPRNPAATEAVRARYGVERMIEAHIALYTGRKGASSQDPVSG